MPNNIVKSFADKSGKSTTEVEEMWNNAENIVKDKYNLSKADGDKYYSAITGLLKKMLKLVDEEFESGVGNTGLASGTPSGGAGLGVYATKIGTKIRHKKRKKIVKNIAKRIFKEYLEDHA